MSARRRLVFAPDIATTATVHRVTSVLRGFLLAPLVVLGVVVHDPLAPDVRYPVLVVVFAAWVAVALWYSYRRTVAEWGGPASILVDLGLLVLMAASSDGVTSYITPIFYLYPIFTVFYYRPALTAAVGLVISGGYAWVWHENLAVNGGPELTGIVWLHFLLLLWMTCATTGLALVLARRARADTEIRLLQESLTAQLIAADQKQAARLADDLHDGPLQDIIAARRLLEGGNDIQTVMQLLSSTTQQLRGTVATLHPHVLLQLGLETAILDLTRRPGALPTTVTVAALPPSTDDVDYVLYAAARELLINAYKHSGATHVAIEVCAGAQHVTLTVSDNGRGLRSVSGPDHVRAGHIGLASHALRIRRLGGELTLETQRPHGTCATVIVPVQAPRPTE